MNNINRIITMLCVCVIVFGLTGCGTQMQTNHEPKISVSTDNKAIKPEANNEKLPPIMMEEVPLDIKILEPDSVTRYMEATYTNNSKHTITSVKVTVLLKDKNEKTYLTNHDTVLSGETSTKFDTFAPATGKYEDLQILKFEIGAESKNGENINIEYDAKLKRYSW